MHFYFTPTTLLSLCFSAALILPIVTGKSIHPPTSPASPLYRRAGEDPGKVIPQVEHLHNFFAKDKKTKIGPRGGNSKKTPELKLNEHMDWIFKHLPKNADFRILFIEYAGSGGDVGKSMTYPEAIKSHSLYSSKANFFIGLLEKFLQKKAKQPRLEMKLAVDCNYLKYMPEETRGKWKTDIEKCSAVDPKKSDAENEKANQAKFMEVVKDYLKTWKPHVVVQGNAMSGLYRGTEDFWKTLHKEMNDLVKDDLLLRINIRADFKQEKEANEKKDQYPLEKNDIVLVGQPVDFFDGYPEKNRQTRIGRPQVQGMDEIPDVLEKWLDKQERIMYLGLGGRQRKRELPKESPTESLDKFLKEALNDPEFDDWSFIMFHNVEQEKGKEEKDPIENDRVYHIWYGINILQLFNHQNVFIVMHHCGRGILDDTIDAVKVPICVGTSDFSDDQFEFADQIEKRKMGKGIVKKEDGVYFENPKEPEYTGKQKSFASQEALIKMTKEVKKDYEAMKEVIETFKPGIIADTSGDLAFEILFNFKYAQGQRNSKSLK